MKRLAATLILLLPLAACSRTSDGTVEMRMAPLTLPALPKLKTPDLSSLWPRRTAPASDAFPELPPPSQAVPARPVKAAAGSAAKPKAATTRRKAPPRGERVQRAKPVVQAKAERPLTCAQAVEVDGRVRMDCR